MEYDRALYRVYERAMEGLLQTQPVLQRTTAPNDSSSSSNIAVGNVETHQGETRQRRLSLPFFWPIFLIRLLESLNSSSLIRSIRDRIRIVLSQQSWWSLTMRSSSLRSVNFLELSVLQENGHDHDDYDAEEDRNDRGGDLELGEDNHGDRGVELTTISQSFGMRRRNNSTSSSASPSREDLSSRSSSLRRQDVTDSSSSHSNSSRTEEEGMVAGNVTITDTTRLAQQIAERHNHRLEQEQEMRQQEGMFSQRGIFALMRICLVFAMFHLFVLWCLHGTYVGPTWIARDKNFNGDMGDYNAKMTCLEYALSTRPIQERNHFYNLHGEDFESHDEDDNDQGKKRDMIKNGTSDTIVVNPNDTVAPLLNRNEILQIKIIYGKNCDDIPGQCSRVHNVVIPENKTDTQIANKTSVVDPIGFIWGKKTTTSPKHVGGISKYSTAAYWENAAYRFSTSEALMFLDETLLSYHNVSIVNVTLSERCLSTGSDDGVYKIWKTRVAQFLSPIYGMDEVIVNQVMYGIKTVQGNYRDGYLQNRETKERWAYSKSQLEEDSKVRKKFMPWLLNRIAVLIISSVAFFLITSVTALIVRLLTSSGAFILFPIFAAFRSWGLNGIDDRVLDFSYPWVGRARRAIRTQNLHPMHHYVGAQIAKLFLVYTMYESCQVAWDSFLYSKSAPANLPLWIFGTAMVCEYFTIIFVRSAVR